MELTIKIRKGNYRDTKLIDSIKEKVFYEIDKLIEKNWINGLITIVDYKNIFKYSTINDTSINFIIPYFTKNDDDYKEELERWNIGL